jgi:hypothetical protein
VAGEGEKRVVSLTLTNDFPRGQNAWLPPMEEILDEGGRRGKSGAAVLEVGNALAEHGEGDAEVGADVDQLMQCFDTKAVESLIGIIDAFCDLLDFAAQIFDQHARVPDLSFEAFESPINLFESPVDLFESAVNLLEPTVNLLESSLNLLEPAVDFFEPRIQAPLRFRELLVE